MIDRDASVERETVTGHVHVVASASPLARCAFRVAAAASLIQRCVPWAITASRAIEWLLEPDIAAEVWLIARGLPEAIATGFRNSLDANRWRPAARTLELAFRELPARVVVHYLGLDELSTTTEDEVVMLIVRWMSNAYPNRFDIADDDVVDDEDFLTFQGAVVKTSMHVRAGLLSPEFREPHLRMLRAKQHAWEYRRGDRGKTDQALALAARPPRPSPSSELHAYLHRPRTGTTSSCPPELVLQLHTHRDNLVAGCNLAGPDVVWRGSEWRVKICQSTDGDMLVLVYRTHPCTKTVMPVYADMYLHFGDATKAEKLTYDCMTGRGYGCGAWDQVDATLARLGWSAPADGSVCLHVRLVVL